MLFSTSIFCRLLSVSTESLFLPYTIRRGVKSGFWRSVKMAQSSPVAAALEPAIDVCAENGTKKQALKTISETSDVEPPVKMSKQEPDTVDKTDKIAGQKRRKFAILLAYCGAGYFGMQRQAGNITIEEVVLEALLKAKLIGGDVLAAPGMAANFQRAARTDKGVSAACQLISLRMAENIEGDTKPSAPEAMVKAINENLPERIRAINVYRVTKSFDAKDFCCARTYCYMMPTYALQDCSEVVEADNKSASYRIDQAKLDAINAFLQNYKGTHNFHNFTSGLSAEDRSAHRYLLSLECGKPFVASADENNPDGPSLEFVTISIKGQSFMLHQIRKMIALMICIIRGTCSMETLGKAWGPDRVDIPMAPALGLFLYRLHFDGYNRRFGSDGMHAPLDWSKVEEELQSFQKRHIFGHIVRTELAEKPMMTWLATLNRHSYDYVRIQPEEGAVKGDVEPPPETSEGVAAQLIDDNVPKN